MNKYIDEIKATLLLASDQKTKEKALQFTSGAKCLGVPVPKIRSLAKAFKQKHSTLTGVELCTVMDALVNDNIREEILFGIFLFADFKNNVLAIPWTKLNSWLDAIDNWETCDQLSSNIAAPIIAKNINLVDELKTLAQSTSLWKRRFAAATAANINHGGRQYPDQTLAICKVLLADKETMVSKAVGWALRELSKKTPDLVFDFLKNNKKNISARLMKESSEKLTKNQQKELI